MNVNDLYGVLSSSDNLKAGTLTLQKDVLGDGAIATTLQKWFPRAMLEIKEIPSGQPEISGNTVTLTGKMSFLGVVRSLVKTVVFYLVDGNGDPAASGTPAMLIEFPLPVKSNKQTPWIFSLSFPTMKGSSLDKLPFQDLGDEVSNSLLISSQTLTAAQAQTLSGLKSLPDLNSDLTFYSDTINLQDPLFTNIAPLLGQYLTCEIYGTIDILSGSINQLDNLVPKINLISPTLSSPPFLGSEISLNFVNPADQTVIAKVDAALFIVSNLKIGEAPVRLSANFSNLGRSLVLEADIETLTTMALDDLSTWAQKAPLGDAFKDFTFALEKTVTVKNIRLFINMIELRQNNLSEALSAVSITLGTPQGQSWTIVKDYFTVEDIDVSFMVNLPVSSDTLFTSVVGTIELLDDVELQVFGSFPDTSFGLSTKQPVNLTQVFEKTGVVGTTGFPELVCQNFYVEATPATSSNPDGGVYDVSLDVTSDWSIDIGVRNIELVDVALELDYNATSKPKTSGDLTISAKIVDKTSGDQVNVPTFVANWNIPGAFEIKGTFPEINLTDLANEIVGAADLSLPSDFPVIDLVNSELALTVEKGQGTNKTQGTKYDFFLETTVELGSDSGLTFVAKVMKTDAGTGLAAGIWTDNWSWSPADLPVWSSTFKTILAGITFTKSGLLVSSLKDAQIVFDGAPSDLPQTVGKGLTFFTEIGFGTSALAKLSTFFGDADGIKLYAYLADHLKNSQFIAKIGDTTTTDRYAFQGFEVIISPATESFSVQAGVSFTFTDVSGNDETLDLLGGGNLSLKGEFDIYFVLKGGSTVTPGSTQPPATSQGWVDPLGVKGLTIENFWGEIGINAEGLLLGFGGDVIIGSYGNNDQVDLELDIVGEFTEADVPIVDVFKFAIKETSPSQNASITQLLSAFTSIDLDWIPILNSVDIKEFMLAVVVLPQGWMNPVTNTLWQPGFRCAGDVSFYGNEALFDIEIDYNKGIKADGEIKDPINLVDGLFVLSDAKGTKGPSGSINTFALTRGGDNTYLSLSGQLKLLAMDDTIEAYVKNDGWEFEWEADNFIFKDKVTCSLIDEKFKGSVTGSLDLDINTGSGVKLGGLEIIPPIHLNIAEASLRLALEINPGFSCGVNGSFSAAGLSLSFDVSVDFKDWNDFASVLEAFLEKYPEQLFKDLLADAKKWAQFVAKEAIKLAEDIAYYLKNSFECIAEDAVKILHAIGQTTDEIINSMVHLWDMAEEDAKKLVFEAADCAMKAATDPFKT